MQIARASLTAALALLLCGASRESHAADCSITAVSLNFGAYDPVVTAPDDSAGTVTVTCRITTQAATRVNYTVTISHGMNGATPAARQMSAGAGRLGYNVFTDPTRSKAWGTGSGGTVIASGAMTVGPGVGNGGGTQTVTHKVYGRIPQLQDAVPGTYSDTLLVTLTF
ncbi:MAG: spore coat protein U domain-containing protein [Gammaproteobacteria bacterium]|nr:spore coat protein U domain-containing protein [Gammaproteobacteria bacterium]